MDSEEKQFAYVKECSNQISSEIQEFYISNAAFLVINGFLVTLVAKPAFLSSDCLPFYIVLLAIIINVIWQIVIKIVARWIIYWRGRAEKININYNIWLPSHKIRFVGFFGIKSLFFLLPIIINLVILIVWHLSCAQECNRFFNWSFFARWPIWLLPIIIFIQILISYADRFVSLFKIVDKLFIKEE